MGASRPAAQRARAIEHGVQHSAAMSCIAELLQAARAPRSQERRPSRPSLVAAASASAAPSGDSSACSRRLALSLGAAAALGLAAASPQAALAFTRPPAGYLLFNDVLDGYSFFYPADWVAVRVRALRAACCSPLHA